MNKIRQLLTSEEVSYIFPFFWQHGEDEETLRDYMKAIHKSGIRAVCVECRPHPDFCGPKWWQDMDVILDEAHKMNMKVWILDDDHFPTGHANGGIENAALQLRPWYVDSVSADCYGPSPVNRFDVTKAIRDKVTFKPFPGMAPERPASQKTFFENDEEILSVTAWEIDKNGRLTNCIDLTGKIRDGILTWDVPNGSFKIYVTFLTHNGDGRTDYINILDHDSVRVLIDEVYEKHFEKYGNDFGKTISGFFSDEPMTGNIAGMYSTGKLGGARHLCNPWQKDLPEMLEKQLGNNWKTMLPLLWGEGTDEETVRVRLAYMDSVTRLIEKNFAGQLSQWCENHGVEYIGHIWEDKHLSYALGGGLGHYYRAMHGNHMGGVDLVFNSEMHPWSHHDTKDSMGGSFYYYTLGKLASSHAHIDPHKQGRALCEIFGATGWDFGVDKMKYLADNFLVSGINRYVPHAFSPKAFPDPDCPPHFYAHGENAQFRAFEKLMQYMQRASHLLSDGKAHPEAAILYHAENDWVSEIDSVKNNMYCDVPAKLLGEAQIDYDIIPVDALLSCLNQDECRTEEGYLSETASYPSVLENGILKVNGYSYKALIVPASDYTSEELAEFSALAEEKEFPVLFIDVLPKASIHGSLRSARGKTVSEKELIPVLKQLGLGEAVLSKESSDLRMLHYTSDTDVYLFVNNDLGVPYDGTITLPDKRTAWIYDPYDNKVRKAVQEKKEDRTVIRETVSAFNPLFIFFSEDDINDTTDTGSLSEYRSDVMNIPGFTVRSCMAKDYPAFSDAVELEVLGDISVLHPEMMDCYRYEAEINWQKNESKEKTVKVFLQMDYVSDPAEVFVNGINCGMRISPDWVYDVTDAIKTGRNLLQIDVFATPARKVDRFYPPEHPMPSMGGSKTERPEGIIGNVCLTCLY